MIQVVSGIKKAGDGSGEILMGKRLPTGRRPDLWELPGGKIEPGETPEAALAREWREEVGVTIRVEDFLAVSMLEVEQSITVSLYVVQLIEPLQTITCRVHTEFRWVKPLHAVQYMPCSPGFYLHYPYIARWMQARARHG